MSSARARRRWPISASPILSRWKAWSRPISTATAAAAAASSRASADLELQRRAEAAAAGDLPAVAEPQGEIAALVAFDAAHMAAVDQPRAVDAHEAQRRQLAFHGGQRLALQQGAAGQLQLDVIAGRLDAEDLGRIEEFAPRPVADFQPPPRRLGLLRHHDGLRLAQGGIE